MSETRSTKSENFHLASLGANSLGPSFIKFERRENKVSSERGSHLGAFSLLLGPLFAEKVDGRAADSLRKVAGGKKLLFLVSFWVLFATRSGPKRANGVWRSTFGRRLAVGQRTQSPMVQWASEAKEQKDAKRRVFAPASHKPQATTGHNNCLLVAQTLFERCRRATASVGEQFLQRKKEKSRLLPSVTALLAVFSPLSSAGRDKKGENCGEKQAEEAGKVESGK